jgi:hypothetical protein
VQDPDLPQISGQEQPADSEREQARPESARENTQAVETAPNAIESQSSDTSTESIDDYAIEDLFKEAAGQIL